MISFKRLLISAHFNSSLSAFYVHGYEHFRDNKHITERNTYK